jgi:hypothetical protein
MAQETLNYSNRIPKCQISWNKNGYKLQVVRLQVAGWQVGRLQVSSSKLQVENNSDF